jgi:hypothetical protein
MIEKIDTYRDGGTIIIKMWTLNPLFAKHVDECHKVEICVDRRIHTATRDKWFIGYPGVGNMIDSDEIIKLICDELRAYRDHILKMVETIIPTPI